MWYSWQSVWMVRSRIMRANLSFWLAVIGYDPRSRSLNQLIYLIYVLLFFTGWIFMVLILLADVSADLLRALPFGSPAQAAVTFGVLVSLALLLFEMFGALRRSPYAFSEEDAFLLCQTPVSRPAVAAIWLMEGWLLRGLGFWPGAVVLAYALLETITPRALQPADLPAYLVAGVRMALVMIPLLLAVLGLAWLPGTWRLRSTARHLRSYVWVAPALSAVLLGAWSLSGWQSLPAWLAPLSFPIQAGLGLAGWQTGLALAAVLAVGVLLAIGWTARGMSLARAAQETRDREALRAATFVGSADVVQEIQLRQRLGFSSRPSRLLARAAQLPAPGLLAGKTWLQALRGFRIVQLLPWLQILALNLGLLWVEDWDARGGFAVLWALIVVRISADLLRKNLSRWWLLHQLPIRAEHLLAGWLALPVVDLWIAGLVAVGLALALGWSVSPTAVYLYAGAAPAAVLAAALDVLRQSKTSELLISRVPGPSILSLILVLVVIVPQVGAAWYLFDRLSLPLSAALLPLTAVSAGMVYLLLRRSAAYLRRIS